MPILEISTVILCVIFLLLLGFSIPLFLQIWRAAKQMTEALESLNQSLPGILKNMDEIATNINSATQMLNTEVEGFTIISRRIRDLLAFTEDAEQIVQRGVKAPLLETLKTARGLLRGLRVFFHVLHEKKPDKV